MFSKRITESDAFLDMPLTTQCLYFHLNMNGDDDGFVNNPKRIMRLIGASEDDLKILISKAFVLVFDSGVIVIKHWRINNTLQNDRYKPTSYKDEYEMLGIKDNESYTWKQNVSILEAQHNITKHNITKHSIDIKHKYGEFKHVMLTDEQYNKLLDSIGETKLKEYITKVDEYCQQYGKHYKDYFLTIRNWYKKDHKEINDDYSIITSNYDSSNNPKLDLKRFEELNNKRKVN